MKLIMTIIIALLSLIIIFGIYKNTQSRAGGIIDGALIKCPNSPNCISSQDGRSSHNFPLTTMNVIEFELLKKKLKSQPNIKIIASDTFYIHAIASTRIGFKDDLEFLFNEQRNECMIRSASRVGQKDFGVNKKRILNLLKL